MIEKSIDKLQILNKGIEILRSSGNCDAEFDAKYIMEEILGEKFPLTIEKI